MAAKETLPPHAAAMYSPVPEVALIDMAKRQKRLAELEGDRNKAANAVVKYWPRASTMAPLPKRQEGGNMNEKRSKELRERLGTAYQMMEGVLQPDEERLPLCADCADWDKVPLALAGCATAVWTLFQRRQIREAVRLMREMAESLYALGYQRGRREAQRPLPQFVLAEESR